MTIAFVRFSRRLGRKRCASRDASALITTCSATRTNSAESAACSIPRCLWRCSRSGQLPNSAVRVGQTVAHRDYKNRRPRQNELMAARRPNPSPCSDARLFMNDIASLLAALGYPDPDSLTTERTIWPAGATIRTSRICSASLTGKTAVTSPEIRHIVQTIYTDHLQLPAEWSAAQRQEFIETEAGKISHQVAELAAEMGEQAVADWIARHGDHPDYLTKVGLLNTAMAAAKEIVLNNELYEMIAKPADSTPSEPIDAEPVLDHSQIPWDQRWTRTRYRTEPSDQIEALAAAIWPDPNYSAVFRIKAGYLLAARAEDQLPLPRHAGDPLAEQLAQMIYADLRHDGLPEH